MRLIFTGKEKPEPDPALAKYGMYESSGPEAGENCAGRYIPAANTESRRPHRFHRQHAS